MTASVRLGGVDLGGDRSYSWELSSGTAPVERLWTVTKARADAIPVGQPLLLELTPDGRETIRFASVYVLEVLPGPNPLQRTLRVADRRWRWPRRWVSAGFNVRRATGNRFLVNDEDQIENAIVQPEIQYAKWSLYPPDNGGAPWNQQQLLEELFRQLDEAVVVRGTFPPVEIQDLEMDDDGASAVERVLRYLPGADVYVDREGFVVVYNTLDGSEGAVLSKTKPRPHVPFQAHAEKVDKSRLRPARVRVLITPEVEIRLNYSEGGTVSRDSNDLRNVCLVPDVKLTLSDGRTVAMGTPVPIESLFSAWGAFGYRNDPLSTAKLRQNALKHGYGALEHEYGNSPLSVFDSVNAARVRAAIQHWRKTYQVAEIFMQRLASIRAVRVAILNTETGQYGPAEVFCDYTRIPTHKGFAKFGDTNINQGWTVQGYADLISGAKPSPAKITVIDPQAGLLRIEPQLSPFGLYQAMEWGYATGGEVPSQLTGEANRTASDLFAQWGTVELSDSFKLAVVVTSIPASPNDIRKFHEEVIEPGEVGEDNAQGPEAYVRVFPGVLTARYAWSDDYGQELVDAIRGLGPLPDPSTACVNLDQVRDVARAAARRLYQLYRDRPEGALAVDMDASLEPTGTVASVRQDMTSGVTESIVSFGQVRRPIDIWAYLSASTRRALQHVLNTGGTRV